MSGLTVVALDYLVSFRFGIQATGDILESVSSSLVKRSVTMSRQLSPVHCSTVRLAGLQT